MRSTYHLVAIIITGSACAGTTQRVGSAGADTPTAERLMQIERDIGTANVRQDRAFFDRVEATEFVFVDGAGRLTTKAEDLASMARSSTTSLKSYVVDSMQVLEYGSSAVVIGRATLAGVRPDGTTYQSVSRFSDVFVWRDKRWQIVTGHSSKISDRPR